MKDFLNDLIIAEKQKADKSFITETLQNGRYRPKRYKHYLSMPFDLFFELKDENVIKIDEYYVLDSYDRSPVFFEFRLNQAFIYFECLYLCEDLHRKIDHYLIVKCSGSYPLKRGGIFF